MRLSRIGWALTAVSAAVVALLAHDAAALVREVRGPSFPDALIAAASLCLLAVAAWSLLAAALVVLGGSSRLLAAVTPTILRRALIAGATGVLVAAPAQAGQLAAPDVPAHSVSGLRLPDRPDATETTVPAAQKRTAAAAETVRVRPGDTLWSIAARSLPHDASPADIAHAMRRWHDTNRDVIGADPDRIFPSQRLTPPSGKDHP
ncbi:LysM peptidoglycan-binding domain-containing protein [Aeromicrobium wangtongii]|uniref:LysM peptidoglycan-binding domain-containing protein n=1 Tax=Aeromicrobium wangtongii TaxID=2969247 RepID=A0ABY5MCD2_9ACTN|nr:LysM domain-containing protein [Aeromicrobium wangtongii]MCD9197079.1 LysM peptidoglycan-binding domain-containing protein [Aeromicrobium wangtongii]UUP14579.1 LysM peptidoglycan-binding domain-containing protein [Aeromicrobium wangtongii]